MNLFGKKLNGGMVNTIGYKIDLEKSYLLPLKKIKFRNIELKIPNKTKELLDLHYITWDIPIADKTKCFKNATISSIKSSEPYLISSDKSIQLIKFFLSSFLIERSISNDKYVILSVSDILYCFKEILK